MKLKMILFLTLILTLVLLAVPSFAQAICANGGVCGPNNKVSWTVATQNTDNSSLVDLAGFKVLFGTSPGVGTAVIGVTTKDVGLTGIPPAPSINTIAMVLMGGLGLPNGKVYVCVKEYNLALLDAGCSNEITFTYQSLSPKPAVDFTAVP